MSSSIAPSRARFATRPQAHAPRRYRLCVQLQQYELAPGETTIGRSPECRLSIDDATMSRVHARILVDDDGVVIADCGSRNGTRVNGKTIHGPHALADGDRIRIGNSEMVLTVETARAPMRSTARMRRCPGCRNPFVADAPCCPRCGERPASGDWLTTEGLISPDDTGFDRRNWWLDLQIEVVERALTLWSLPDAEQGIRRIAGVFEERFAAGDVFDPPRIDAALAIALRVGCAVGDPGWIGWVCGALRALQRPPHGALLDRMRVLPPILALAAVDAFEALACELEAESKDLEGAAVVRGMVAEFRAWRPSARAEGDATLRRELTEVPRPPDAPAISESGTARNPC